MIESVAKPPPLQPSGDGGAGTSLPAPAIPPRESFREVMADVIAYIRAQGSHRVKIGPKVCSCKADFCDLPGQRYCLTCRRDYRKRHKEERLNRSQLSVLFHTEAFQVGLAALRDSA